MKKIIMLAAVVAGATAMAASAVSVTGVTAKQRWPWNNLVDVEFTVAAPAGEVYRVVLDAECAGGAKKFSAATFLSDPTATAGSNHVIWDFGADYPNVRAEDMQVTVSLAPYSEATPIYMKIDLSGGPTATKYPVTYSFTGPAHVQGATDEPCQTTELWLRRIRHYAAAMPFHRFSYQAGGTSFYGKLTKDYYIGVFELTQRQYELVMDSNPSFFSNRTCYASRPVENVVASRDLYGRNMNIQLHPESLTSSSFFGRLRAKTGLPLVVPSSMQFEYALRAGYYTGEYYRYKIYDESGSLYVPAAVDISRCSGNSNSSSANGDSDANTGTAPVGSYLPNMFGLYDMMGNVYELTCEYVKSWNEREMTADLAVLREAAGDETLGTTKDNPVIDYRGQDPASPGNIYRTMGGCYSKSVTIWNEGWYASEQGAWNVNSITGFRVSMTVE